MLRSDADMTDYICCKEFSTVSWTYPLRGTYKSATAAPAEYQPNSSRKELQILHISTPSFQEQCEIGTDFHLQCLKHPWMNSDHSSGRDMLH